jgi:acetylornithine deacetylase
MSHLREKIATSLSPVETRKLVKDIIEIPSVTGDETELAIYVADFLKTAGVEVELQEVKKGKLQTIGRIRGHGEGQSIMLCGHLDIFPPTITMNNPYKAIFTDNRVYGAGIGDMKSGVAAMLMAAQAIQKSGVRLKGDVVIAAVMEEEIGGVGITHLLNSGITADMGIVPECHNLQIHTVGAGIAQFTISTLGKSTHVSAKEQGVDAIAKMMKAIQALDQIQFTHEPDSRVPLLPRFTMGSIIGGRGRQYDLRGAQNLSDYCSVIMDVRFWKSQTVKTIEDDLRRILNTLATKDPDFRYELSGVPSPFENRAINRNPKDVSRDALIVKLVQKNHAYITGSPAKFEDTKNTAGSDDGSHMNEAGIPTITYGPGPGESDVDQWNSLPLAERWIDFNTILTCAKVLALTAFDCCSMDKP